MKMPIRPSLHLAPKRLRKQIASFLARQLHLEIQTESTSAPLSSPAHYHMNFPALTSADLLEAKLFAKRQDLVAALGIPSRGVIAEVGVGLGDFSRYLIEILDPAQFVAIDTFEMHNSPQHEGRACSEIFGSLSHEDFYRARLQSEQDRIMICRGLSHQMVRGFPDQYFDLIYVDAGHDYVSVVNDASASAPKVKPDGVLAFNDYTLFDSYGVIPAVNELVRAGGWKVVGFALQHHMFCDIALRKTE